MHDLIKNYTGKGTFTFGTDLSVPFDFVFHLLPTPECRIFIRDEAPTLDSLRVFQRVLGDRLLECTLDGETYDGGKITCKRLYVNETKFKLDETHGIPLFIELLPFDDVTILYPAVTNADNEQKVYLLTNLLFAGNEFVHRGQQHDRAKSVVEINDTRLDFIRLFTFDQTKERLKNSTCALVTTEVTSNGHLDLSEELNQLIWPLCYLCSLGQHCFVSPLYSAIKAGDSWKKISYNPFTKTYPFNRLDACIDFGYQGDLKDFKRYLERCYGGYKRWVEILRLDILIEYAVHANAARVDDLCYLLLCIGLECLADNGKTYLESQGVEFLSPSLEQNITMLRQFMEKHNFEISDDELRKLARSVSYNQPSLKEKLCQIFEYFNVSFTNDDLKFIDIRNNLVHKGMLPEDIDATHKECQKLKDLYDKVILTILGYKGGRHILRWEDFKLTTLE